jgi:hypothetical protein
MEWTAIACLILLSAATFHDHFSQLAASLLRVASNAKSARLGQFEFESNSAHVLSPSHLGLLVQHHQDPRMKPNKAILKRLRELRNRGLISHNR